MVITFPKQSEAMVTLFHGEGNFLLLFWYTTWITRHLGKTIECSLLFSKTEHKNESIWRWEYCCCSYSVTCWSSYANWASAKLGLFCTLTATVFFCLGRLSTIMASVKGGPLDTLNSSWNSNKFGSCHVLTIKNFIISPCIRIWLCTMYSREWGKSLQFWMKYAFCEARRASHCHSPQTTYSSKSTCCTVSAQKTAM